MSLYTFLLTAYGNKAYENINFQDFGISLIFMFFIKIKNNKILEIGFLKQKAARKDSCGSGGKLFFTSGE